MQGGLEMVAMLTGGGHRDCCCGLLYKKEDHNLFTNHWFFLDAILDIASFDKTCSSDLSK